MKAESKALLKDIALTTLVLVVIAIVAGGILGGVNALTYVDPAIKANQKLSSLYESPDGFTDLDAELTNDAGSIVRAVKPNNDSGDIIIIASGNGAYKKTIEIMIVINNYEIKNIFKYASEETPGLGANAFKDDHIEQYLGSFKDIDGYELSKKGGTIDAVTAATKTSTAMNNAVNVAITCYKANIDNWMGGADNE